MGLPHAGRPFPSACPGVLSVDRESVFTPSVALSLGQEQVCSNCLWCQGLREPLRPRAGLEGSDLAPCVGRCQLCSSPVPRPCVTSPFSAPLQGVSEGPGKRLA